MGIQYWQDVSILAGSIELAAQAKNFKGNVDVVALDTTPLSVTNGYRTFIAGRKSGAFSVDLMSEFTDDGQNETLDGYMSATGVPKSFVLASADGSPAYMMNSIPLSYTPFEGGPSDLAVGKWSGSATGPVVRGTLMHPSATARTSSGSGTARQLGAVSATQRVYAALHVLSASGTTPSLTVTVQSDTVGFGSPTTQITMTAATARTYQWASAPGAITDDYWRVGWTISGTTPSFLFGVTIGII